MPGFVRRMIWILVNWIHEGFFCLIKVFCFFTLSGFKYRLGFQQSH